MSEPTGPVTKEEALLMLNKHLTQKFVDVDVLCEMFEWQAKLSALVLRQFVAANTNKQPLGQAT